MPAPPSGNLLDVFEARDLRYLARLRRNARLLRLRKQIHMPMVVLSANRPKQTTQGRPVHNECELIDTIDTIDRQEWTPQERSGVRCGPMSKRSASTHDPAQTGV